MRGPPSEGLRLGVHAHTNRARVGGHRGEQVRLGEDDPCLRVLQHEGEPVGGIGRVQREVRGTGLQGGQHGDGHVQALVQAQAHRASGGHAQLHQVVRELIGPRIQLRVGERAGAVADGDCIRRTPDLGLERTVHQHGRVGHVRGVVEVHQQLPPLILAEELQAGDGLARVGHGRLHQPHQVAAHSPRSRLVEEVGVVFERSGDVVFEVREQQREVELGRAAVHVQALHGAGIAAASTVGFWLPLARGVHQREHHLEQRGAAQVPLQLQRVHQLLEGDVLVGVRAQRGLLHLGEQLAQAHAGRQPPAQGEGVDEEADDALQLGALAVGDGRAHHDVVLTRVARQQHLEDRQKAHEGRDALALAPLLEGGRECLPQAQRDDAAAVRLHGRAGTVGGQLQRMRYAMELVAPPGHLPLQRLVAQPAALPGRVVRVLERQRRQWRRQPANEGRVEQPHLAQEDAGGPAIRHDVLDGDEHHMAVVRQPHQRGAQQRRHRQVEGCLRLRMRLTPGRLVTLGLGQMAQVHEGQRQLRVRVDALDGLAILHGVEAGAEHLMATDELLEGAGEGLAVQGAVDAHGEGDVVEGAAGLELVEEPDALLREGQR